MSVKCAAVALAVLVSGTVGCHSQTDVVLEVPFLVGAHSDDGKPVASVAIQINGEPLGKTDGEGELHAMLTGTEGALFRVEATCPDGYFSPGELPRVVLGRFATLADKDGRLAVTVVCERQHRAVAIVVRTRMERRKVTVSRRGHVGKAVNTPGEVPVEGIPVLVNGKERARTDAAGLAHLAFEAPPGTAIEVVLQTEAPGLAMLNPRSPAQGLSVHSTDDIYPVDQLFIAERFVVVRPAPPKHVIRMMKEGLDLTESAIVKVRRRGNVVSPF